MVEGTTDTALLGGAGADTGEHWSGEYELGEGVGAQLGKFKSVEDALNGYGNLEKLQGRSISLPKDDASDEDKAKRMSEIYAKLGRPEKAEGYAIEKPVDMPEGLQWSDEAAAAVKTMAHDIGLSQPQMNALVAFDIERQKGWVEKHKAAQAELADKQNDEAASAIATLKAKWGESKYEENKAGAEKACMKHGGEAVVKALDKSGLKNHPAFTEMFYSIYKETMAEDHILPGAGRTGDIPKGGIVYDHSPDMKGS